MNIINGKIMGDAEDITGDVGAVITGDNQTIHLGTGNVVVETVYGPGVTIVRGNNPGGIRKTFGGKSKKGTRK